MDQTETAKTASGIKMPGPGCAKCYALEDAVRATLEELRMDTTIDYMTDFTQIVIYGVMSTQAFVVDGKAVSYGKMLNKHETKAVIQKARHRHSGGNGDVYRSPLLYLS